MKLSYFAAPVLLSILTGCGSMKLEDLSSIGGMNSPSIGDVDVGRALSAGKDIADAAMLDDQEVQAMAMQYASSLDKSAQVAPSGSKYAVRLKKITAGLQNEDGLNLNFKAYLSPEVNAFSLADGTIRVHSGLMDKCTDDEVLAVIGHEIGHVKLGHSKARVQMAHASAGVIKGAGSMNNLAGAAADSELIGGTLDKLINAQFSQSNEMDSDDYSVTFLQKHGKDPREMIGALNVLSKLAEAEGKDSKSFRFFSTHPGSGARAERLEEEIGSGDLKPVTASAQVKSSEKKTEVDEVAVTEKDSGEKVTAIEPKESTKVARVAQTKANTLKPQLPKVQLVRSPKPGYYVQVVAYTEPADADVMLKRLDDASLRATTQVAIVDGIKYTRVFVGPFQTRSEAQASVNNLSGGVFSEETPFIQQVK